LILGIFPHFFHDLLIIQQCIFQSLGVWIFSVVSFVVDLQFHSIVIWWIRGGYFYFPGFVKPYFMS
jgi:hypothetical protein